MITGLGKNVGAIHEIWADLLFRNLRILRFCDFFVCWSLIRNYRVSRMWWNAIKWPRHSLEWEPFSFEGGPRHWLPFHLNLAIITSISAPPDFLYFSYISAVCLQEHRHDSSGKQTDLRTFLSSAFPSRTGMKVLILCKFVPFNSGTKNKDKGQVFQEPSLS